MSVYFYDFSVYGILISMVFHFLPQNLNQGLVSGRWRQFIIQYFH